VRLKLWLKWIIRELDGIEVNLEEYLLDYYAKHHETVSESIMIERVSILKSFLLKRKKYKCNMVISDMNNFKSNVWNAQKFSKLALDLLHIGILSSDLKCIIASMFVNLMYASSGDYDLISTTTWNNLKTVGSENGEYVKYVIENTCGLSGIDCEIPKKLFNNLMVYKYLIFSIRKRGTSFVEFEEFKDEKILDDYRPSVLFNVMRCGIDVYKMIQISKTDFYLSEGVLGFGESDILKCLDFDPSVKPNGDFNYFHGVHDFPVGVLVSDDIVEKNLDIIRETMLAFHE
jgi:hypothetical protein